MLQAPHTWFIVAQVRSFGEWLSIIARSELGSDLDCSVINARSELGSNLDCYELKFMDIVNLIELHGTQTVNYTAMKKKTFQKRPKHFVFLRGYNINNIKTTLVNVLRLFRDTATHQIRDPKPMLF